MNQRPYPSGELGLHRGGIFKTLDLDETPNDSASYVEQNCMTLIISTKSQPLAKYSYM